MVISAFFTLTASSLGFTGRHGPSYLTIHPGLTHHHQKTPWERFQWSMMGNVHARRLVSVWGFLHRVPKWGNLTFTYLQCYKLDSVFIIFLDPVTLWAASLLFSLLHIYVFVLYLPGLVFLLILARDRCKIFILIIKSSMCKLVCFCFLEIILLFSDYSLPRAWVISHKIMFLLIHNRSQRQLCGKERGYGSPEQNTDLRVKCL